MGAPMGLAMATASLTMAVSTVSLLCSLPRSFSTASPPGYTAVAENDIRDVSEQPQAQQRNPYAAVEDYLSNVSRFKIIESTLREGEQFANAFFTTEKKIEESVPYVATVLH
jgi:hypothetical protein